MDPVRSKLAFLAASGRASPSSQLAWCGSPQAICTTLIPSRSQSLRSSGILLTCSDQLQTPMDRGCIAMRRLLLLGTSSCSGSWGRFNVAAQWTELAAIVSVLVKGEDLVSL